LPGELQTTALGLQTLMPKASSYSEQLQSLIGDVTEKDSLHPYISTLGLADLGSCVTLESAAFPENERVCNLSNPYSVSPALHRLELESTSSTALLRPFRNIVAFVVVADNSCWRFYALVSKRKGRAMQFFILSSTVLLSKLCFFLFIWFLRPTSP